MASMKSGADTKKLLEIIEMRAAEVNCERLIREVCQLLSESESNASVKIYKNLRPGTDWSIHLLYEAKELDLQGSELAILIKEILKKFGIVYHSIWLEQPFNINKQ